MKLRARALENWLEEHGEEGPHSFFLLCLMRLLPLLTVRMVRLSWLFLFFWRTACAASPTAIRTYGQGGSFLTGTSNLGGVSASSLATPAIASMGQQDVYVADSVNHV